jgi:uncharacterized protein YjgD (DUF1641 family)
MDDKLVEAHQPPPSQMPEPVPPLPGLAAAFQTLERLQASGALAALADVVQLLHLLQSSLTDEMIARLADKARASLEALDAIMRSGLLEAMPGIAVALREARREAVTGKPLGFLDLWRALRDPQVQDTLRFLLALARHLPVALRQ